MPVQTLCHIIVNLTRGRQVNKLQSITHTKIVNFDLYLFVFSPDPATESATDQVLVLQPSGNELSTKTAISLLLLIFCSSLLAMGLVWKTFPDMNPEDQESIKFPKDLDDAKKLGQVLSRYKEQYFAQVC